MLKASQPSLLTACYPTRSRKSNFYCSTPDSFKTGVASLFRGTTKFSSPPPPFGLISFIKLQKQIYLQGINHQVARCHHWKCQEAIALLWNRNRGSTETADHFSGKKKRTCS